MLQSPAVRDDGRADPTPGTAKRAPAPHHAHSSRGASGGLLAGVVGALPVLGTAVAGACVGCVGVGSAAVAGAATGAGISAAGLLAGLGVLAVVVGAQLVRLGRRCQPGPAGHRQTVRSVGVLVASAAISFALVQWVVAPVITPDVPVTRLTQLP